ncbi:collagen binding domain-containing protein [Periweissella fabaria]|uniref:Uncharacterized protein n=1 Tax=Periweissella fabaria TaxID=546157 RepID=A0ABN8BL99_9LACO|nr:SpaA isopeptide-forming pilin-related protein [Periweissella fabaria]MCM0597596.1 collagen binding domain-containing protein [Periweissella fabaria]CAH0416780.1 hypothetical protein WFA24289_01093 [Periweissella fabaria]
MQFVYKILVFLLLLGQIVTPIATVSASETGNPITAISATTKSVGGSDGSSNYERSGSENSTMKDLSSESRYSKQDSQSLTSSSNNDEKKENNKSITNETLVADNPTNDKLDDKKPVKVAAANGPVNITNLLPSNIHGTIIDNVDVSFTDKSGNSVKPNEIKQDTNISLVYHWSVPNELSDGSSVKSGDTFDFKLPDHVSYPPFSTPKPMGDYATYTIDSNGVVHMTFTDSVDGLSDISGNFNYEKHQIEVSQPGEIVIEIPTKLDTQTTKVIVKPTGGDVITKKGNLDKPINANNVTWTVDVNTSNQQLTNAQVKEAMPSELSYASSEVYLLNVDINGNPTSNGAQLIKGIDYTADNEGNITFKGNYADTTRAFRVIYHTAINQDAKPADGGSITIKNTAHLINGSQDTPASAQVVPSYGKMLAKDGHQINSNQEMTWDIDFNKSEKTLTDKQAIITDTLDKNSSYIQDSVEVTDDNNNKVAYKLVFDDTKNTMQVSFPNGLNKGVHITYHTKYNAPLPDGKTQTISNSVKGGGADTVTTHGKLAPVGIVKDVTDYDYVGKAVQWTIHFNQDQQIFNNLSLTDTMSKGLSLIQEDSNHKFEIFDETSGKIVSNDAYQVTKSGQGFKLSIDENKLAATDSIHNHTYKLVYWTATNYDYMANGQFSNSADYAWTDTQGVKHENKTDVPWSPTTNAVNDGVKHGNYNANTKNISWSVGVNFQERKLTNATIADTIKDEQKYVKDSAKLYEVTSLDNNGNYKLGNQITDAKIEFNDATKTLTAMLPPTDKMYVLQYDTNLDGLMIKSEYTNTAKFSNGNTVKDLSAKVAITNGDKTLSKTGNQNKNDSSLMDWNLTFNASQSFIRNAVITDTPSDNQTVALSTIKIQQAGVDKNGNLIGLLSGSEPLVEGIDYKLKSDKSGSSFTITFLHDIDTAYYISYSALIDGDDTVYNSAELSGNGTKSIQKTDPKKITIHNDSGSSSATSFNVSVIKQSSNTNASLQGAVFTLTSKSTGKVLDTQTTDANGKLSFSKLRSGTYYVQETKAPAGYRVDDHIVTITLSSLKTTDGTYSWINNSTAKYVAYDDAMVKSVVLSKIDSDTNFPLSNASFDLYNNDKPVEKYKGLKTDSNGKIVLYDLEPGHYYFVETKAPDGYSYDVNKQYEFDVKPNQTDDDAVQITAENAVKFGSVILTKTDLSTNKTLANAEYDILDAQHNTIHANLRTNDEGQIKVNYLKPGQYYFKESKAPDGYELDDTEIPFTVKLQTAANATPVAVSAKNAEKTGSVKLTKTDSDTKEVLPGAMFTLFQKDGTEVQKDLITDAK